MNTTACVGQHHNLCRSRQEVYFVLNRTDKESPFSCEFTSEMLCVSSFSQTEKLLNVFKITRGNFLENGFWPPPIVEMDQKILHSWDDVLGPYPRDGPEGCPKARDGHHVSA